MIREHITVNLGIEEYGVQDGFVSEEVWKLIDFLS